MGNTPILSVASELEGYDSLQFENSAGISAAVDYLASHGRKHIGMIAGDLNNDEFVQRYEAYRRGLEANALAFQDSYMIACSLSDRCDREVELLLDRNPELDAIVCATDMIAANVYDVLKKRNIRVGIDVAVVGYDDLPMAAKLTPPLASVRADAVLLGKRSVDKAVNHLNGAKDACRYLESQFIPRQSCFKYVDDSSLADRIFCGDFSAMVARFKGYFAKPHEDAASSRNSCDQIIALLEHLNENYVERPIDEGVVEDTISMLDQAMPLREAPEIDSMLDGAVIGRMGGDEFAAIVPASSDVTIEALTGRKEQFIERFNASREKPYHFGVSMGMVECVCDDSYDLRAALDKADDLLYIEKSRKKKRT